MEGSTEENSTKESSMSSPFMKVSEQVSSAGGTERGVLSIQDSDASGGRGLHRNSKISTDRDGFISSLNSIHEARHPSTSTVTKAMCTIPFWKLWSFATPLDYLLMTVGALAAIVHGAILPVMLHLVGRVVDLLGSNQTDLEFAYQKVFQISLNLVYIAAGSIFVIWLEVACWMSTGQRQVVQIRTRYLKALLSQSMPYFEEDIITDEIMYRLSRNMLIIQEAMGEKVGSFILNISIFVVGILVAFLETWQVALLTSCTVPLLLGTGIAYGKLYSRLLLRAHVLAVKADSIATEAIAHVQTVYSLVGESRTISEFSQALQAAAKLGIIGSLVTGAGIGVSLGILNFSWAVALWYGDILIRKGSTNGGALLAAVFCVIYSGRALGQALPELQVFVQGRLAAFRIFEVISSDMMDNHLNGETLTSVRGEIQFSSVQFSYPSRPSVTIFSDLTLTFREGETVALVGKGGSGKTSILSLIQRFYTPNSGEVRLDGHNLKALQLSWLRMQIGFVSQEPILFADTIRQNILNGKLDASAEDVEAAAFTANAHSFISKLPLGYETLVGGRGTQLSEGQKQRLAIARAIVKKPAILLLDEATSALDAQTEQNALESIKQGHTTVLVAHRLSTVQYADLIVVLDHGIVVETGSHNQLLGKGNYGVYASLVRLHEAGPAGQDDLEARLLFSTYHGSTTPQSSEQSGATSPLDASLLQSPVTPSTHSRALEERSNSQENSYPDSPFVLELPPSPATPTPDRKRIIEYLREKEQVVSNRPSDASYWNIYKLLSPELPSVIVGTVGAIISGCSNPIFALYFVDIIQLYYSPDKQLKRTTQKVNMWCIVIAGLGLGNIGSTIVQNFFFNKAGENTTMLFHRKLFTAIMKNEVGWFDSNGHTSSVLTAKMSSCGVAMKVAICERAPICIQHFTSLGVAIALAFVIQWKIAAVTIILIPFTMIAGHMKTRFVQDGFVGDLEKSHENATQVACEAISNIQTVAAFNLEHHVLCRFTENLQAPSRHTVRRAHQAGLLFGMSQAGMLAATAVTIWYFTFMVKNKQTTYWSSLKVYQILWMMGLLPTEAWRVLPDLRRGLQATICLLDIANHKTEIDPEPSDGLRPVVLTGRVELDNVTFWYPTRPSEAALSNFSLTIPAGHTVALVGPSGSGKSSVIALLERFYDPTSGTVLMDGFNVRTLDLRWLRRRIGLVQQEPALFTLSVRENIRYGRETASEAEVIEAARKANAHGFISSLPSGYDSLLGEEGVQLSGGQKQRIAIARAVIQNPQILLLDEPTSALDTQSEKVVQDALDNILLEERRTTVVIAHRVVSIQHADSIVFIKNGQIRETGRHSALMAMDGAYARLVQLQNST